MSKIDIKSAITHSGGFHLDELVGLGILRMLNPSLEIARSRDPEDWTKYDLRIDVGGEYDPENHSYDHHQKGGAGTRENGVAYASAGLIWKHFGHQLANSQEAFDIVDHNLMEFVDRVDNGVAPPAKGTYTLQNIIRNLNGQVIRDELGATEGFYFGLELVEMAVQLEIHNANAQHLANEPVREDLQQYEDKAYAVLRSETGWEPVVVGESDKLFVVYQSRDNLYRVRCVPTEVGGFTSRQPLPKPWRGLMDEDLEKASGIKDAAFCHQNGFIASLRTYDAAIEMAQLITQVPAPL